MVARICVGVSAVLLSACVGCGNADRADLEKARAELAEARAELKLLKAEKSQGYLDELERLESLRAKGTLTPEEFEAKKRAVLKTGTRQEGPVSAVDELAKQLRMLQGLYNSSTITNIERDQKKRQLVEGPLSLTDLKKDLETVQGLYGEGIITNLERDALKKRLLEMEPTRK